MDSALCELLLASGLVQTEGHATARGRNTAESNMAGHQQVTP